MFQEKVILLFLLTKMDFQWKFLTSSSWHFDVLYSPQPSPKKKKKGVGGDGTGGHTKLALPQEC